MESTNGLPRALAAGESVILSSGSTAIVRKSYLAGYAGDVEILLDGSEEKELASNLSFVEQKPFDPGPARGDAAAAQREMRETRAPSREMKN